MHEKLKFKLRAASGSPFTKLGRTCTTSYLIRVTWCVQYHSAPAGRRKEKKKREKKWAEKNPKVLLEK